MKRSRTGVALMVLALATAAAADDVERVAAELTPPLPAVGRMPEVPEAFRRSGPQQSDGQRAFRDYAAAVRDRLQAQGGAGDLVGLLDRFLNEPKSFRLRRDHASEAFLQVAGRFAERQLFEPVIAAASGLIGFPTWRRESDRDDPEFLAAMGSLDGWLKQTVAALNAAQPGAEPLVPIDWKAPAKDGRQAWILGARVGRGPRRIALITHVDTVGPIRDDWRPFEARLEVVPFRGTEQLFLRGRGSIDDKGPTAAALQALDVLRSVYSGTPLFDECTFELVADTAEETHHWIPDYFDAVGAPWAGDVLDAAWSLYAEKGSESPIFRVPADSRIESKKLRLVSLTTPPGPRNQIPDQATAIFDPGPDGVKVDRERLAAAIADYLKTDNERARLELAESGPQLRVIATGSGAAHGSAPDVNKARGHNPLACLSSFVAFLWRQEALEAADPVSLPLFLAWAFGHDVHGEGHPELLLAKDEVFTDGTTYALTRLTEAKQGFEARIDIRYALGHHSTPWDHKTFGSLPGKSRFPEIFTKLLARFNATLPLGVTPVQFETETRVGPDLKDRTSPLFLSLLGSYEAVVGHPSPVLAIGGGTDAKGYPTLFACGPNFSSEMTEVFDPPVNYHGAGEGAPVQDLTRSAEILVRWLAVTGLEAP
jgi:succinyl-diaminopimelate desuccinylase